MKIKYFVFDMEDLEVTDIYTDRRKDVKKMLLDSGLPREYQFVMFGYNKSWAAAYEDSVRLGDSHNSKMFELISNHPFNCFVDKKKNVDISSATFGYYLRFFSDKRLSGVTEADVVDFYKRLIDAGYRDTYLNLIYSIFTNAYEKEYPLLPDGIALVRKNRNDK